MKTRTGIDIVDVVEFEKQMSSKGKSFLDGLFSQEEIGSGKPEHLAGVFAAKEAVMKALSLKPGSWMDIKIKKDGKGRPKVDVISFDGEIESSDLSISHTGRIAVAVFVAFLK